MKKSPRRAGELIVAGMGLRMEHMSAETGLELKRCGRVYTSLHGGYVEDFLRTIVKDLRLMPHDGPRSAARLDEIVGLLKRGVAIGYLVAGNPMLLSGIAQRLVERCRSAGIPCKVLPAVSSLDAALCAVEPLDGEWNGFKVIYGSALDVEIGRWDASLPVFVLGLNSFCEKKSPKLIRALAGRLRRRYPARHPMRLIEYRVGIGNGSDEIREGLVMDLERELQAIKDFPRVKGRQYMGTLYLPGLTRTR